MPSRAIIYGNVIDAAGRRRIMADRSHGDECLLWRSTPVNLAKNDNPALVVVDLDDPRFSQADFLMAMAEKNVKLVGKLDRPTVEETIRVSKFGVSEVLNSAQCLQRLDSFINDLQAEVPSEKDESSRFGLEAIIGRSRTIEEIRKTIRALSEVDFPSALILGETGTGKSLVSKVLHHTGLRARHNLVEVNCSAIPDELFESELFGHTKGAFTDAKGDKTGLFEYAQNGTLFLDEVGNLSPSAQAKLLKILEDKKLRKVGDVGEKDINVRVVAATNLDLHQAIEAGKFREDLYFRLNLLTIEIPSLRQRPEDIPEVARHFLHFYTTIYNKADMTIEDEALNEMAGHSWPGNVRELSNVIERAVLLNKNRTIRQKDIRLALKKSRVGPAERRQVIINLPPQGLNLRQIEVYVVKQVLDMFNWNKSEAAQYLGISRPRLRRILEEAGLEQNRRND